MLGELKNLCKKPQRGTKNICQPGGLKSREKTYQKRRSCDDLIDKLP